jgi:hypothetical protein
MLIPTNANALERPTPNAYNANPQFPPAFFDANPSSLIPLTLPFVCQYSQLASPSPCLAAAIGEHHLILSKSYPNIQTHETQQTSYSHHCAVLHHYLKGLQSR